MVFVKSLITKFIQWDRKPGHPGTETPNSISKRSCAPGAGKMSIKKAMAPVFLVFILLNAACKYIVLPEDLEIQGASGKGSTGWNAVATNIGKSDSGDLHIDLTIRNGTGDWSAMKAVEGKPAVLTSEGESINCETVFVSTGGHRLAPGFQMRGYTTGTKAEPMTQPIYVECAGVEASPGATLSIPYSYVTGQYNYYEQDKNIIDDKLEIDLDTMSADLEYPVFEAVDGLIQEPGAEIEAINKVVLALAGVERTDGGLQFSWNTTTLVNTPLTSILACRRSSVRMVFCTGIMRPRISSPCRSLRQQIRRIGRPLFQFLKMSAVCISCLAWKLEKQGSLRITLSISPINSRGSRI
jgi:hypothetical protein